MIHVLCILRSRDRQNIPPHDVDGFVPVLNCPLAIAPACYYDLAKDAWAEVESVHRRHWKALHRPTGFYLGSDAYSREDAERLLLACEPDFPAWQYAMGSVDDLATIACRYKFNQALKATNVRSISIKS